MCKFAETYFQIGLRNACVDTLVNFKILLKYYIINNNLKPY